MAYGRELAERLREALAGESGLLIRAEPGSIDALLDEPRVSRFRMRGRDLNGWLHVSADAVASAQPGSASGTAGVRHRDLGGQ